MNSLFYRKDKNPLDVKGVVKKVLRNRRVVVALALGIPLLLFVLFGSHGVVQRLRLQGQKADLEMKIQEAETETKRLQAESKALDGDKKAIEKVAREKYGMVREGETVYKVRKEK